MNNPKNDRDLQQALNKGFIQECNKASTSYNAREFTALILLEGTSVTGKPFKKVITVDKTDPGFVEFLNQYAASYWAKFLLGEHALKAQAQAQE